MRSQLLKVLTLLILASALSVVTATVTASTKLKTSKPEPLAQVFVIVLENRGFDQVIGNPNLPNFKRLAKIYGLASQFYGEAHPSLPNYEIGRASCRERV